MTWLQFWADLKIFLFAVEFIPSLGLIQPAVELFL
jgi:hypothetical protein